MTSTARTATQRTTPIGNSRTQQHTAIEQVLHAQNGFCSAQDVYAMLRGAGRGVGLSTVYRHLKALADQGRADVIHTADGETAYRLCWSAADRKHHHHHLICRMCGRTEEVQARAIERWSGEVADLHGYGDVDHIVELFGTCPDCAK